jgi:hypothetical protein
MIQTILAPTVSKSFQKRLRNFDPNLRAIFNCETERFEILRWASNKWNWIIAVENDDNSFRPLDERIFKKLYEMDIIARYGSIANWEKHMDEMQAKWRKSEDDRDNHNLKCDLKDDRILWQRAEENFRSGIVNDLPEEKHKKIISYAK